MTNIEAAFDLTDVADADANSDTFAMSATESLTEAEQWADAVVDRAIQAADIRDCDKPVVFDIETGPRPTEEIEQFYSAPEALPPWDDSMVKYGNAKKEELRAQKLQEQRAAYESHLENEAAAREAHKADWLSKAALSPVTGRVLLIGYLIQGETPRCFSGESEAEIIGHFWDMVETALYNRRPIIGHNSNGFDLPFLVRRSWLLGVPVPREVRQGRYWNPLFRDTMDTWTLGAREYVKLNTLGQYFGCGQKTEGVDGGDFGKLWFGTEEERALAMEYNAQDLRLTAAIAGKMGLL